MSKPKIVTTASRLPARTAASPGRRAPLALLLATTALTSPLLIATALAQTLPTGASVAAGNVTIAQPSATQLNVTQSSQSAVVNYQSFSIGQGSSVNFAQPNSSSAILNRVTGTTLSSIAGSITANGQVYLVNPNGIAITNSGTVNVGGGFVASTLGISDADFMAGKRTFTGNGASSSVSNAGTIRVGRGGYTALIGGTVSNSGLIDVPLGKVGLGSGERATLDFAGDGFLQVAMPTNATSKRALIRNSGTIRADGGSVILTAATAREAARNAINMSGTIQARSIGGHNGAITIGGGDGGRVRITGRLIATSRHHTGGTITVTGKSITLKHATLDASGARGGGTINIGGGRQGTGPLQRAESVSIDSKTTIKADATRTGNGGNVTVWSDGTTAVYGTISATGGPNGGDGGQIETSGHTLDFAGIRVDASAVKGKAGTWLLDPEDLSVDTAAAGTISSALNGGSNVTLMTTSTTASGIGNVSNGNGDIFVNASISWASSALLTLRAYNAISINAPINVNGAGGVSLTYNTVSPTNLTFRNGASIDYGATDKGGSLSINSQSYALVYSMAQLGNISTRGQSALATSLFATSDGTANGTPTIYTTGSVVAPANVFYSGTFEGLGHTISSLTINNTDNGRYTGLFGLVTGTIRNLGLVGGSVTGANQSVVGALAGQFSTSSNSSFIVNVWSSVNVTGGDAAQVGGLVGQVQAGGSATLIVNSSSTGNVTVGATVNQFAFAGGLVGYQNASGGNATISGSYATGTVTGGNNTSLGGPILGGLVGYNNSSNGRTAAIVNSYATGPVGAPNANSVGGLVGVNTTNGDFSSISSSFATGAVFGGLNVNGGLVGANSSNGTDRGLASITDSYATGAVRGLSGGGASGGLVGLNQGVNTGGIATISTSYATGRVTTTGAVRGLSGGGASGGLVGLNQGVNTGGIATISTSYATGRVTTTGYGGTGGLVGHDQRVFGGTTSISNSYWDTSTSGILTAGIGSDPSGLSSNVTGLTTAQFQSGTLPTGFSSGVWGTGISLYPYLTGIFRNGVQAVSGFAYTDGGSTPLASGTAGAASVNVIAGGSAFGSATTGANGYFYTARAAGSIANGQSVLAYTNANGTTGATDAATLTTATGVTNLGTTLYGNALSAATPATLLSAVKDGVSVAAGSNSAALAAIAGTSNYLLTTTGASFTVDQAVSGRQFSVSTLSGAPLTVARTVNITNGGVLGLNSGGTLAINAPITVAGATNVSLAASFDTTTAPGTSILNLSFGPGASIDYGATNIGGTLSINGQSYNLLYSMSDLTGVNGNLGGLYALATNLDATSNSYTSAVIAAGLPYNAPYFTGTLTGLGNSISNLSIANTVNSTAIGLFGLNSGTIRDLRLVGGSVATTGIANSTGALVGFNQGVIADVSSSVAVSGGVRADYIGGLVGFSDASTRSVAIVNASATGAVSMTNGNAGGLVGLQQGRNGYTATIANSFSTGSVTGIFGDTAGGLVGVSQAVDGGTAAITNSYSTGGVFLGGQTSVAGGLVGQNGAVRNGAVASLTNVYATGAVLTSRSQATAGGLIGTNQTFDNGSATTLPATPIVNAYWNTQTSGRSNAIGSDNANQAGNIAGLTTQQLQSGAASGLGAAFSGGANGLYPYLTNFFPNGIEVIAGTAYTDAGTRGLAGASVGLIANGVLVRSVSTGANGYYYAFGQPGAATNGQTLLAYTNAPAAATLTSVAMNAVTGGKLQTGVNLYGNALTTSTAAITLTAADIDVAASLNAAAGGNSGALAAISAATGRSLIATGAGFTVDRDVTTSGVFAVQTTATNAAITVSNPITINGGSLGLLASGTLAINALVTVNGAGAVALGYDASNATNLSFGLTGAGFANSLTFANANGSAASTAVTGQSLSINGQAYTLLYNTTDVQGINSGLAGNYAVATNIDATSFGNFTPIGGEGLYYTGAFDGLGHTISNLTIEKSFGSVAPFGWVGVGGSVAHIGIVGGTVTGGSGAYVGGLVAYNNGAVTQSYATSAVKGGSSVIIGGLVGYNAQQGTITQSYTTGAVTGGEYASVGGLAGYNYYGTIANVYAIGAVTGGANATAGGLASFNGGTIVNAFATGAVSAGGSNGIAAGFVAQNNGGIFHSYATGAVRANGIVGGFVGSNNGGFTNSYWDTQTSGQANGIGTNYYSQGGVVTGLTTRQLQGLDIIPGGAAISAVNNLGDGTTSAFSGGANGLYPYLSSFFPNGIQVLTGTAYTDAASRPLAGVSVGLIGNGSSFGTVSTGANGYYYAFGQPGTLTNGQTLLAYTNAPAAATLTSVATNAINGNSQLQTGVNLYGSALTASTAAITLTAADIDVATVMNAAAGSNAAARTAIANATGRNLIATGASFTIDRNVTTSGVFAVQTSTANAPITVSNPITINGGSLGLLSSGTLAINAPITVNGSGSVRLAAGFDTTTVAGASLLRLSFGNGAGLTYANADGSAATASQGGTLAINGQAYTLLYNLADPGSQGPDGSLDGIAGIDFNSAAGGSAGFYALATNLLGTGTAANAQFNRALVGTQGAAFSGVFEGLGHTITNLTMADTGNFDIALFQHNTGTIRNIGLVGGSFSNGGGRTAPLVAWNFGQGIVANAYSSATVSGGGDTGGLVGASLGYDPTDLAVVINSYATGAVTGTAEYANVGGLVGKVNVASGTSRVIDSYATGAVIQQGQSGFAGGLVGFLDGASIERSYATGAVSGVNSANLGGFLGINQFGNVSRSYWDTQTSGQSTGIGNDMGTTSDITGLMTLQLQGSFASGLGASFSGGANGLYPYLTSFFPGGVQAVSGVAYADAGTRPLASNANGANSVAVIANGNRFGSATTGANGSYYVFGAAGSIAAGNSLLAYSSRNGVAVTMATADPAQSGGTLYGNAITIATTATSLSSAPSIADARSAVTPAAGSDAGALAAISAATGRNIVTTGASFEIDSAVSLSDTLRIETIATNAGLTVSNPIAIGGGSLGLIASGALAINAPVTVDGAGTVVLAAGNRSIDNGFGNTVANVLDLTFGDGASLTYKNGDGSAATTAVAGQALVINGQSYTLLYNMGDVTNVNNALAGRYALAGSLDAAGTIYTSGVIAGGDTSFNSTAFSGTLEGLGHTIANLRIDAGTNNFVGLIGYSTGTVRDLGMVGGRVTGSGNFVGGLAGYNLGTITQAYATGTVSASNSVGGLAGYNLGTITQAYATGAVSGLKSVGGLAGYNFGTIIQAYATGAVSGSNSVGGLAGYNRGIITQAYATGAVTGTVNTGGLIGVNRGAVSQTYWDTQTSGQSSSSDGIGLTTRQLQGVDLLPNGLNFFSANDLGNNNSSAFGGGTNGLYPYLKSFSPYGVQAFTGTAYSNAGATLNGSGSNGVVYVNLLANGTAVGQANTGANGYYYIQRSLAAPFTPVESNSQNLLAYIPGTTPAGATLATASGGRLQTGLNIYGNALTVETSASRFSLAPQNADDARNLNATALASASGSNADAQAAIANALGLGLNIFGGSFNIDRTPTITGSLIINACACAPLTVSAPINLSAGQGLGLLAGGALAINAPINLNGAGSVVLTSSSHQIFDDVGAPRASVPDLSFGNGASLTYNNADGSQATASVAGQTLAINGKAYTLLYNMTDVTNVNTTGLSGNYAIATNLNATGTIYTSGVIAGGDSSGDSPVAFSGRLDGLGHTIANLTINGGSNNFVGLIGSSSGAIANLGLAGGRISGSHYVGGLVGESSGTIQASFATGAVSGDSAVGGLAGTSDGVVLNSYAASAVSSLNGIAVGGLIGLNTGVIQDSYATGAVSGDIAGGLVGNFISGAIRTSFATGAVSGSSGGGLIGRYFGGTIESSYYDLNTTGRSVDIGVSFNVPQTSGTGLTSRHLQGLDPISGATYFSVVNDLGDGSASAFNGGANGLYPYLTSFSPNGVQAISGLAYQDNGVNLLRSGINGAGVVTVAIGGQTYTATTGANGYYYVAVNAGTISSGGTGVLAYTQANTTTGARDGAMFDTSLRDTTANYNVKGGLLDERAASSVTSLSALNTAYAITAGMSEGATLAPANRRIRADASSFTVDTSATVNGSFDLSSAGGITLGTGTTLTGTDVTLSAPGAFTNNAGSAAISASHRWLVFSANPAGDTFGNLDSGNAAVWGVSDLNSVTQAGNRYVFAYSPTLTVATTNASKTYGDDATNTVASAYTISGLQDGVSGAYRGDSAYSIYSGGASVTSAGSAVTGNAGRYAYTLDRGSLALLAGSGYSGIAMVNAGMLTVGQRALTVTADAKSRIYGEANPPLTYAIGGIVNGDALTGQLATSATVTSNVGAYGITQGSLGQGSLGNANYAITYTSADLTVTQRALTVTADAKSRIYGDANPALTYTIGGLGLVNGDALTGQLATSATVTSAAGSYSITQGDFAASSNYRLSYVGALLTVQPAVQPLPPASLPPAQQGSPVIDAAAPASSVVRDSFQWIALPDDTSPLPGVLPETTPFGVGVFYSDPRFGRALICFGGGGGTAASCLVAGR
jgi:filamentous hemagglutinin family protein